MREIYLLRHAHSNLDPNLPPEQWGLTPAGVEPARAAGDELKAAGLVAIFCSTEPKARRTADLIEHRRDSWGFLGDEEFKKAVHDLFETPGESIIGAETGKRAAHRFADAIGEADKTSPPGPIALVGHGTVI
jgi:broad specificity phosphatase PhoE